jgi:hypothetical protein
MFNDTHMHKWHSPARSHAITGTWTAAAGAIGNTIVYKKTANAETSIITVPIELPMNDGPAKGAYLVSVDVYYELLSAVATTVDALIYKITLPANTAAIGTAESLAFSYDTGSDTAGERNTQDQHTMTLTLTTPVWVEDDHVIQVQITFVCGGTVVVDWIGARANYTYRL